MVMGCNLYYELLVQVIDNAGQHAARSKGSKEKLDKGLHSIEVSYNCRVYSRVV